MEMKKVLVNGQWEIILPEHRAERPEWKLENGGWEKKRLQSIHSNVKEGGVFYYIGAECFDMCGLISMWGAELVVVEPNSIVYPNAKAIWETNNIKMPLVCFVGFASNKTILKDGVILYNGFPDCANGEIIPNHGFKELSKEADNYPQIKIDDLVTATGYIPNYISCDCEGSEFEIMRGAEQTLRNHKPLIWLSIHPEFLFDQYKEYSGDLRNWIKKIGYKETILDYQHELHTLYTPA